MPIDWSEVGKAKIWSSQGNYFPQDGSFKLRVIRSFTIKTRTKGDAFIVDFEVLESNHDEVKQGDTKNWYRSLQDPDIAFGNIKEFMMALLSIDDLDEDEMASFEEELPGLMEEAGSDEWNSKKMDVEEHPLNGRTIGLETRGVLTREGKEFTVHDWSPWDEEE